MINSIIGTLINAPSPSLLFLAGEAGRLLCLRSLTIAAAESCTGGLIAKTFTDIPGSSEFFTGGVAAYSNSVKQSVLGVSGATLGKFGAVSPQTAAEMARGVRLKLGADIGISATGIAGPGGGSDEKPVGLVYTAVSTPSGTHTFKLLFPQNFNRAKIRRLTAIHLLAALISDKTKELNQNT